MNLENVRMLGLAAGHLGDLLGNRRPCRVSRQGALMDVREVK